jgi:hypothetical protein
VACSRGRKGIEAFVESVADLSQIQNRTGDRKASVGMAFGDQADGRVEAKELFCHLRRIRAAKGPVEHARTVHLCRQAAEALEPDKDQKCAVDLQEHAIRSAQRAARRAEVHAWQEASTRTENTSRAEAGAVAWAGSSLRQNLWFDSA